MKISSNIFFTVIIIIIVIIVASGCKKDKERELTEDNSVFTSLTLNDSIGERTWNIMLDTIFQKVNNNGFVNTNLESFLEVKQANKSYKSYNSTWNNIINDSVDIYISTSFYEGDNNSITNTYSSNITISKRVHIDEIVIKKDQFYFKSFDKMKELFSIQDLSFQHKLEVNNYVSFYFGERVIGKAWRLGSITDTSNINLNGAYYFKISKVDVNQSDENLYLTMSYNIPVSDIDLAATGMLNGTARILIKNIRF